MISRTRRCAVARHVDVEQADVRTLADGRGVDEAAGRVTKVGAGRRTACRLRAPREPRGVRARGRRRATRRTSLTGGTPPPSSRALKALRRSRNALPIASACPCMLVRAEAPAGQAPPASPKRSKPSPSSTTRSVPRGRDQPGRDRGRGMDARHSRPPRTRSARAPRDPRRRPDSRREVEPDFAPEAPATSSAASAITTSTDSSIKVRARIARRESSSARLRGGDRLQRLRAAGETLERRTMNASCSCATPSCRSRAIRRRSSWTAVRSARPRQ